MKLKSTTLKIELNDEEISGGEVLISDDVVKLKLKDQQLESLITITFRDKESLICFWGWLTKNIPIRKENDMTRESIYNGIEELKSSNE